MTASFTTCLRHFAQLVMPVSLHVLAYGCSSCCCRNCCCCCCCCCHSVSLNSKFIFRFVDNFLPFCYFNNIHFTLRCCCCRCCVCCLDVFIPLTETCILPTVLLCECLLALACCAPLHFLDAQHLFFRSFLPFWLLALSTVICARCFWLSLQCPHCSLAFFWLLSIEL